MGVRLRNHLGDIVRALRGTGARTDEQCARVAGLLGFEWGGAGLPEKSAPGESRSTLPRGRNERMPQVSTRVDHKVSDSWLRSMEREQQHVLPQWYVDATLLPSALGECDHIDPVPLCPEQWLRTLLRDCLLSASPSREVDIEAVLDRLSQGQIITQLPRRVIGALQFGAQVVVDRHAAMQPFVEDQLQIMREVLRLLSKFQVELVFTAGNPFWMEDQRSGQKVGYTPPPRGWSVLLLTDFGSGPGCTHDSASRPVAWKEFVSHLLEQGITVAGLVPGSRCRVSPALRRRVRIVPWDRTVLSRSIARDAEDVRVSVTDGSRAQRRIQQVSYANPAVARLATFLSLAHRIPHGLLRHARLEFCPGEDARLEAELWFSPLVQTRAADAILFYPEVSKELQQLLVRSGKLEDAWRFLQRFHSIRPRLVQLQEKLTWLTLKGDQESLGEFRAHVASIVKSMVEQNRSGLGTWALGTLARIPLADASEQVAVLKAVARNSNREVSGTKKEGLEWLPESGHAIVVRNSGVTTVGLFVQGGRLRISDPPEDGSELLRIPDEPIRRLGVGGREYAWNRDEAAPTINIDEGMPLTIDVSGVETCELTPIQNVLAECRAKWTKALHILVTHGQTVMGPAFPLPGKRMVTTRRILAAMGNPAEVNVQSVVPAGTVLQARIPPGRTVFSSDLQQSDDVLVMDLADESQVADCSPRREAKANSIVYALSCTETGSPVWTRFRVTKTEGLGLRLQPLCMLRWLEQQSWSGALLIDSESNESVGFAIAQLGGMGIASLPIGGVASLLDKLQRVRRPRVNIPYTVHVAQEPVRHEIPFVVGVLGNFTGSSDRVPLDVRQFIYVDRDNLNDFLRASAPSLDLQVSNYLGADDSVLAVRLQFHSMQDFEPAKVAEQIPAAKALLKTRSDCEEWLTILEERVLSSQDIYDSVAPATNQGLSQAEADIAEPAPVVADTVLTEMTPLLARLEQGILRGRAELLLMLRSACAAKEWTDPEALQPFLTRKVELVDAMLSRQIAEVMHHPHFQSLEGSWRGLQYLVTSTDTAEDLKIQVWNVGKDELASDFRRSSTLDRGCLYDKLYRHRFGTAGGEPFGALLCDYWFDHSPADVELLTNISQVAAAVHCPVISAASPHVFGLNSFANLYRIHDVASKFRGIEYASWNTLRESEQSKYLVLTVPRVLARLPYGETTMPTKEFHFEELPITAAGSPPVPADSDYYCWMNPAYAYMTCLTNAFRETGLCVAIEGVHGGGQVSGLASHTFQSEDGDLAVNSPTEIQISDRREAELGNLGFQTLCHYKNTDYAFFSKSVTLHQIPSSEWHDEQARRKDVIASGLPCIMVLSRFAHYLMRIFSLQIGSFREQKEVETVLSRWIREYVSADENPAEEEKIRCPLKYAEVQVTESPSRPGTYQVIAQLQPRLMVEELPGPVTVRCNIPTMD